MPPPACPAPAAAPAPAAPGRSRCAGEVCGDERRGGEGKSRAGEFLLLLSSPFYRLRGVGLSRLRGEERNRRLLRQLQPPAAASRPRGPTPAHSAQRGAPAAACGARAVSPPHFSGSFREGLLPALGCFQTSGKLKLLLPAEFSPAFGEIPLALPALRKLLVSEFIAC